MNLKVAEKEGQMFGRRVEVFTSISKKKIALLFVDCQFKILLIKVLEYSLQQLQVAKSESI